MDGSSGQANVALPEYMPKTYRNNPRTLITHLWISSLLLTVIIFICACATAHFNAKSHQGFEGAGFAAIWVTLILIGMGVYGTFVLRQWRTGLSVGIFLGCVFMLVQMLLVSFAVFVGLANEDDGADHSAEKGFAAFSFFLFLNYLFLFVALIKCRSILIIDDSFEAKDSAPGLPGSTPTGPPV
eukprot:CAMPEP_0113933870 /NCGR_PEP_ID=MMETSP1339-20121228/1188_1 /TAXON_ID=94617 /ORGANISM="Fibrocapsa japonica" /LENGTH=183 /DNA_ID=CAMNT_0000935375 /DNA_START=96 /DNA_END=647 /DNA_ORIENTATION=+ /assembly_acc=CAM_ASM_000762